MRNIFLIAAAALVVVLLAGFIALGLYPPHPHPHTVDRVLPNDQFQTR